MNNLLILADTSVDNINVKRNYKAIIQTDLYCNYVILYLEEIFYHKDENNTVEKQIFKAVDIKDVNNKKIKIPEERKNTIIVSKKEMEFLKKEYYDKQMNYFKSKSEVKN